MHDYWLQRSRGEPRPVSGDEGTELIRWLLRIPGSAAQVVANMGRIPISSDPWDLGLLRELEESELVLNDVETAMRVALHVLSSKEPGLYDSGATGRLIERAAARRAPVELTNGLCEQAVRLSLSVPAEHCQ